MSCLPGTSRRAIAPAMSPTTIKVMISPSMVCSFRWDAIVSRRGAAEGRWADVFTEAPLGLVQYTPREG